MKFTSRFFGLNNDQHIELNEAALLIQCALRVYQSKKKSRETFNRRFIKLYDALNDEFVYKDKQTDYVHPSKPFILGDEDLTSPRILEAPDDYDPGYDDVHKNGFALIITVNSFVYNDKIPDLPVETSVEHEMLKEILSHDYVCKFLPDRVLDLINPTCAQFLAAFQHLQKVCTSSDYLLVYICTHIITAYKGEKNRNENGYFLMHESKWKSSKDVASSSISISLLISLLNKILSKEKTILLNCAHIEKTPSNIFGSKILYPPSNCFERISDMANCAVIGNCSIGSLVTDIINHTALPIKHDTNTTTISFEEVLYNSKNENNEIKNTLPTSTIVNNPHTAQKRLSVFKTPKRPSIFDLKSETVPVPPVREAFINRFKRILSQYRAKISSRNSMLLPVSSPNQEQALGVDKERHDRSIINKAKIKKKGVAEPQYVSELTPAIRADIFSRHTTDWQLTLKTEIKPSLRPTVPVMSWDKGVGVHDFKFELPTENDLKKHEFNIIKWKMKRTIGPPYNILKKLYRRHEERNRKAPLQIGLLNDKGTLFGGAVIAALKGGASSTLNPVVSAEMLFISIKNSMDKFLDIKTSLTTGVYKYDHVFKGEESTKAKTAKITKDKKHKKKLAKKKALNDKKKKLLKEKKYTADVDKARKEGKEIPKFPSDNEKKESSQESDKLSQSAILIVPKHLKGSPRIALNVVAIRCSVPPAPLRPLVTHIGINEVSLAWSDPPFSGVPATLYRIFYKSKARKFIEWMQVPNLRDLNKCEYTVKNMIVGVPCRFRICAYNNGGWGAHSEQSEWVIPGSNSPSTFQLISMGVQRSRLAKGGPLTILDRLEGNPLNREEQLWGLSRLRSMAQVVGGYKKGNVQRKAALAGLHGIKIFPADPEMGGLVFSLLGW
eukprot:CAMPEP_0119043238 /NCGR_PEP_ID=MMETSP1177-20130426/19666_1 /TAXON_ID=2985 /ORGANISM="Ochromonas sp, Strain CCMP1899" /LENGTH=893 /DNA_ID=CAMNT_0007010929 /DNA_START=292 /DNA_END=2970 /DNA_ORIENTATION=-